MQGLQSRAGWGYFPRVQLSLSDIETTAITLENLMCENVIILRFSGLEKYSTQLITPCCPNVFASPLQHLSGDFTNSKGSPNAHIGCGKSTGAHRCPCAHGCPHAPWMPTCPTDAHVPHRPPQGGSETASRHCSGCRSEVSRRPHAPSPRATSL